MKNYIGYNLYVMEDTQIFGKVIDGNPLRSMGFIKISGRVLSGIYKDKSELIDFCSNGFIDVQDIIDNTMTPVELNVRITDIKYIIAVSPKVAQVVISRDKSVWENKTPDMPGMNLRVEDVFKTARILNSIKMYNIKKAHSPIEYIRDMAVLGEEGLRKINGIGKGTVRYEILPKLVELGIIEDEKGGFALKFV